MFKSSVLSVRNKPSIKDVAPYMFRKYDDDKVYCLSCNQVNAGNDDQTLSVHFDTCSRTANKPSELTVFKCEPCNVTVKGLNQWQYHHVGTDGHRDRCAAVGGRLYSNTCRFCEQVFYGTDKAVGSHVRAEHQSSNQSVQQLITLELPLISVFMAYVYDVHAAAAAADRVDVIHYCGVCKTWGVGQLIHSVRHKTWGDGLVEADDGELLNTHYCPTCRVSFVCDAFTYKLHLSSAEHGALLDKAATCAHREDNDGWKAPRIVRRRFGRLLGVRADQAPELATCDSCELKTADVMKHAQSCAAAERPRPLLPAVSDYRRFRCGGACSVWLDGLDEWTRHVVSEQHVAACIETFRYTYYECAVCSELYYGPGGHDERPHCDHQLQPLGAVAELVRHVYGETNAASADHEDGLTFYFWQQTGNFGRCRRSKRPASVPHYCPACRLEFYGDADAFRQHAVTAEHLIHQRYAPATDDEYGRKLVARLITDVQSVMDTFLGFVLLSVRHCYGYVKKQFQIQ